MSEAEREKVINQEIAKIQKENDEGGKYTVSVRSFSREMNITISFIKTIKTFV